MERVPIESSQCPGPKRTLTLEPLEQRLLLQADWTFMVYLDGDNNLESAALKDFAEMAHVGSTADVNIVVQMDRSPLDQTSGQGYTNADGDWSGARVGLVNQNDVPDTTWGTALGDTDMGDPNVLQAFLTSAMTSYQANHYAVILWDHGNGYDGAEYDDTSGTHLSLADISSALSGALTATGVAKFDLLNFDGCNMNTAEVANQVENVAGILVGSEDVEPLDGLPYDQVLGSLTAQPQMTAAELGNTIAQDYQTYYSGTLGGNYSVIDLTEMGPLSSALSGFATTFMNDATATDRFRFGLHLATVPHYFSPDGDNMVDLGVLMTDLSGDAQMSQGVRTAANDVLNVYGFAILNSYASPLSQGSGMSIYLPDSTGTVDPFYNDANLNFAATTQWDEFLTYWTGNAEAASWTFIVYMCGDNNLETFALDDFLEMAGVGSTQSVNIVVELDRAGLDPRYEGWSGARRGIVEQGDVPDTSWGTSVGATDMGNPQSLTDFVTWAETNFPAEHYALTLWDHGGGLAGAIFDDNIDGANAGQPDNLSVKDMDQGLQGVPTKLDLLDLDACDMSMLEVAYQVRSDATYMVASEDLGWAVGNLGTLSPYGDVLRSLTTNPSMSAGELANTMAFDYFHSWSIGNLTVMNTVIDLSKVAALATSVDNLAQTALNVGTTQDRILMENYREAAPFYPSDGSEGDIVVDLGTWLSGVANDTSITPAISQAAATALGAYDSAVLEDYTTPGTGTGLAIYMPGTVPTGIFDPNTGDIIPYSWQSFSFAGDTQWPEFLTWWASSTVSPFATYVSGTARVSFYDVQGIQDVSPSDILVQMSGNSVKSITLIGIDPMRGLGIVISGAVSVGTIKDMRVNPADISFIVSNTGAKSVQINSSIDGDLLNGRSLGGVILPSDIDGDGNIYDTTSLYFGGGIQKLALNGTLYGGALINGPVRSFQINNGDLVDDVVINGDMGKMQGTGTDFPWIWSGLTVNGNVKQLSMPNGSILPGAVVNITGMLSKADIGFIMAGSVSIGTPVDDDTIATVPVDSFDPSTVSFSYTPGATLQVGQGVGRLTVGWFSPGGLFYTTSDGSANAFVVPTDGTDQRYFMSYMMSNVLTPSIGRLDVLFGVANARILAGATLGADHLPGGTGANADTYGVGYIGSVNVGTGARKQGLIFGSMVLGGLDGIQYGPGEVGDSLIAAGIFAANVTGLTPNVGLNGGSGYNLVTMHNQFLFEDGSYIGKVNLLGNLVSVYSEPEAAGSDFADPTADPVLFPRFVPFGIGSYEMGKISINGAPNSPASITTSFGIWPRQAYLFVELPRGLNFNA